MKRSPNDLMRIAGAAAPEQPPAIGPPKLGTLSVRLTEETLEALATYAIEHGITQRQLIAEGLAKRGIAVARHDLDDRPAFRRRGRAR